MRVNYGSGRTEFGPGVEINLTGDEVALAVHAWLTAHDVHIRGPSTISVNGSLCECGHVYIDPSGFVIVDGIRLSGRGLSSQPSNQINDGKDHQIAE